MREFALQLARAGVPPFPIEVWWDGKRWRKKPHIKNWSSLASTNPATIEAWWRTWPNAMVGVPLNRTNLVIIDCDRHGDGQDGVALLREIELPPHQSSTTLSSGEHHFFSQPEPPIWSTTWAGGEVLGRGRGNGKFVAAYDLAPWIEPAPVLPADLLEKLGAHRGNEDQKHKMRPFISTDAEFSPTPTKSVLIRSKYLLRKVETAPAPRANQAGERNATLHWAACRFGNMIGEGKFKSREVAEHLLIEAAKVNGLWRDDGEKQCLDTIQSGLETGIVEWRNFTSR